MKIKRNDRYVYLAVAAGLLLAGAFFLCSCRKQEDGPAGEQGSGLQATEEAGECPADKLPAYLMKECPETPYACAEITITKTAGGAKDREGKAAVVWKTFSKAEEFQAYLSEREQQQGGASGGNVGEWIYYQYRLPGDTHAIDIYSFLKKCYDMEENSLYAVKYDEGYRECYAFIQYPFREMVVRDGVIYTLECPAGSETMAEDAVRELLMDFGKRVQNNNDPYYSGWVMDEETLYWADHRERVTRQENPSRTFTEVRAVDINWSGAAIMEYFGMLKEAEYQIRLWEDGPLLEIRFDFAKEIPAEGYEAFLLNGFCIDEQYKMTVTDRDRGEVWQETNVAMSIELPDMVTFTDLNGDGFSDMQIGLPTHWNGDRAQMDQFADYSYLLWSPEENMFVSRQKFQPRESGREDRQTGEKDGVEYVVRPGDTLWGIARRFYGTGTLYREIEEENADTLSGYRYLMPETVLRIPDSD